VSELALYRKYRSQTFAAVIGQPHIVETLQNAIASDRLSHAYLFTGPRGTGKTSVARLLARAANCTNDDPAARPCNACPNCQAEIGSHLDLIEIDAASNRGIDDARALRDKISSAPSMGRYKVYIIDEVHMLTNEAFNALLKTLEEPPAHAIFILATTESHKLPETIISRTQRFSFKPLTTAAMIPHLREIAERESIKIGDDGLAVIAASSRGGFRDAISLLDQAASSEHETLDANAIRSLLGESDPAIVRDIMQVVQAGQAAQALQILDQAWEAGVQPGQLCRQLIEGWRRQLKTPAPDGQSGASLAMAALAIDTLLPVLRTTWPELALESALARLASPAGTAPTAVAVVALATAPAVSSTPKPAAPKASQPEPAVEPGVQPNGDLWLKTLTQIKQRNNSLYALLRSCSLEFRDDEVIIGCKFGFFRDRLKEGKNLQLIEQALSRVYGRKFRLTVQLETKPVAAGVAGPEVNDELVSSALEILGGEVMGE
jgi:DNA polymerase-3 subunit gamma/tau